MAPDINSLPSSPRTDRPLSSSTSDLPTRLPPSRRASQIMGPPTALASGAMTPGMQERPHRSPVISTHEQNNMPIRHPRPLTRAELYEQCEKEQEAVVNRLARELTALRAQTASVVSNNSLSSNSTSTSLLPIDISDPNHTHQMVGATHPTPSRRHRSSSSVSNRSLPTPSTSVSAAGSGISTQVQAGSLASGHPGLHSAQSQASFARAAAAGGSLSRQPSISARSGASTPARQSVDNMRYPASAGGVPSGGTFFTLPHRPSISRDASTASVNSMAAHAGTPLPPASLNLPSPSQSPSVTTQHFTDTAAYRSEMEIVKAENESLRQRVRALERALQTRRRDSNQSEAAAQASELTGKVDFTRRVARESVPTSPVAPAAAGIAAWAAGDGGVGGVAGPRERSESQSTTASSRRGTVAVLGEDDVKVGESAGSVGFGRGM